MMRWLVHVFAPFYDHGRRWLGINPGDVDRMIARGALATLNGATLTITEPDNAYAFSAPKHLHRRKVAAWVNEFNRRSRRSAGWG